MRGELDLYRQQHRELIDAAVRLGAVERGTLATAAGAAQVRARIAELSGKLLVHLQMEDGSLYPELLRSESAVVRTVAARFQREMGLLRSGADAVFRRWLRPAAIEREPEAFLAELRPLLHALAARIAAEDAELYPAAERDR